MSSASDSCLPAIVEEAITSELTCAQPNLSLSKNQQKRLIREQRRAENKTEWRKLQKSKRKLKEIIKKEELKAQGIYLLFFGS